MMRAKKRTGFVLPFFLTALLVLGALLAYRAFFRRPRSFPAIDAGSYSGSISGIASMKKMPLTLFIERFANPDSFLVVVFISGWKPQIISPRIVEDWHSTWGNGAVPFEPLRISHAGENYTLYGKQQNDAFAGKVLTDDGRRGTWNIRPLSPLTLRKSSEFTPDSFNLPHWLATKAKWRLMKTELAGIEKQILDEQGKEQKLRGFVEEEQALKERAKLRREALAAEVKDFAVRRKEVVQHVRSLVSELGLLERITKRGKVVNLARKVAARETKWYLANWGTEKEGSGLEERLAEQANVDLQKLNAAYGKAQEIYNLQQEANKEREQIVRLRTQLEERQRLPVEIAPGIRRENRERPPAKQPAEESWNPFQGWFEE